MSVVLKNRILAIAAFSAATLIGQISPDTAIEQFQLPLFDEAGYRVWELNGERVTYKSETQIKIEGMEVNQFIGNDENREVAKLTSPEATFHFNTTTAYGPGELLVETNAFKVTGNDWIWQGNERQITFNNRVKVILYEEIGDILK